jgi:hypothetical protein
LGWAKVEVEANSNIKDEVGVNLRLEVKAEVES